MVSRIKKLNVLVWFVLVGEGGKGLGRRRYRVIFSSFVLLIVIVLEAMRGVLLCRAC